MSVLGKRKSYGYDEDQEQLEGRLRAALIINRNDLDNEISHQPTLYMDASDLFSFCASKRDHFKNELARLEGAVAQELRAAEGKQTESAIKEQIPLDTEVIATKGYLGFWQDKMNTASGLRDSIEQRGRMLKELTALYIAGYYQSGAVVSSKHKVNDFDAQEGRKAMHRARLAKQSTEN